MKDPHHRSPDYGSLYPAMAPTWHRCAGDQLLVHGAGGVTGGLLVALGTLRGAQVIATAGPEGQMTGLRHLLHAHGAESWAGASQLRRAATEGKVPTMISSHKT